MAAIGISTTAGAGAVAVAQHLGMGTALTTATLAVLGSGLAAAVGAGLVEPLRARADTTSDAAETAIAELARRDRVLEMTRAATSALATTSTVEEVLDIIHRVAGEVLYAHEVHRVDAGLRCRAVIEGRTTATSTTNDVDACPHAAGTEQSVMCVPIGGDRPWAVLSCLGPAGLLPDPTTQIALERVAAKAAERLTALESSANAVEVRDPLTGLPNHLGAVRRIRELIGSLTPFSLAVCDLDDFAGFNRDHGAEAGDRALQRYARLLGDTLRPDDLVCRYGGDVFLVVFPNCSALHARQAMERVREAVALDRAAGGAPTVTFSAGIADSYQGASIEELLDAAADAVDVAKAGGGNRVGVAPVDIHPLPPR